MTQDRFRPDPANRSRRPLRPLDERALAQVVGGSSFEFEPERVKFGKRS